METVYFWEGLMSKLGNRKKSPQEVVSLLTEAIRSAESGEQSKTAEVVSKAISELKLMLFGTSDSQPNAEHVQRLAALACETDLLLVLSSNLKMMEFETRKNTVSVFNNLLRQEHNEQPVLDTIADTEGQAIQTALMDGYESNETALNSGAMLRECLRQEQFTKNLINSDAIWQFFELVEVSDFVIASDAFQTFKDVLTRHQKPVAEFIEDNYDEFCAKFNGLLQSNNYVARLQSLKLLGEILADRSYIRFMMKYIKSPENLKLSMTLLVDWRKRIQFEVFNVFKMFIANPHKPPEIQSILEKNQVKLVTFLDDFLTDREDEVFQEERGMITTMINEL